MGLFISLGYGFDLQFSSVYTIAMCSRLFTLVRSGVFTPWRRQPMDRHRVRAVREPPRPNDW